MRKGSLKSSSNTGPCQAWPQSKSCCCNHQWYYYMSVHQDGIDPPSSSSEGVIDPVNARAKSLFNDFILRGRDLTVLNTNILLWLLVDDTGINVSHLKKGLIRTLFSNQLVSTPKTPTNTGQIDDEFVLCTNPVIRTHMIRKDIFHLVCNLRRH